MSRNMLNFFHFFLIWCFSTHVSRTCMGTYAILKIENFNCRGSRLHTHGLIFHLRFLIRCCFILLYTLNRKFVLPLSSQASNLRLLIPRLVKNSYQILKPRLYFRFLTLCFVRTFNPITEIADLFTIYLVVLGSHGKFKVRARCVVVW